MWFNHIDIELRYPSWPPRAESAAPGRHRVALDRYLERKTRREVERRRHHFANFEQVYTRYEFAPLVELAMTIAAWARKRLAEKPVRPGATDVDGPSGADQAFP